MALAAPLAALLAASPVATTAPPAQSAGAARVQPPELRPLLVTVDDLPIAATRLHPQPADRAAVTRAMLDALRLHHIRAVGLVTWGNVTRASDRQLLEQWLQAGHELGNHSFGHLDYTRTPADSFILDVERGRVELQRLLAERGQRVRFFRFPFLREGDTPAKLDSMAAYLERSGQRNLRVTIDNQDWSFEEPWVAAVNAHDPERMADIGLDYQASLRLAVRHHEARGDRLAGRPLPQILLLHASAVSGAQWDSLFTWLERQGHRFVSADEALADSVFGEPVTYVGPYGCGLWDRLSSARREQGARAALTALLSEQAAAWTRGDLDAFCSVYAHDALFIAPSGTTRGRAAVLERYRARYPDRATMGALTLEPMEVRLASGTEFTPQGDAVPSRIHGASIAARWTLTFPAAPDRAPATGMTLLVLRPMGDRWEIVQDASF